MKLINLYIEWLKNSFSEREVNGWMEVVTPFVDKNNDQIQLYLSQKDSRILLTDDGSTFSNLELAGFSKTEKRADILGTVFRGFGVDWTEDSDIQLSCTNEDFPEKFHNFLQTILAVDNLGYFSESNVKSMFFEDVAVWLETNNISYVANRELIGRSGLSFKFPFYIPGDKTYQKSLIQLVGNPKHTPKAQLFEWADLNDPNIKKITLVNDDYIKPSRKFNDAFAEYGVTSLKWSEKDRLLEELVS